ncbi:Serine protease Hip1 (Hydrolase important for pathogenesis 1) (Serine hydrolase Hip1) [Durusdinium trenchii]|uniref:Serine protease Hip1 (Hydrolase important for pathogenesis 1) (Serine hydrolase Hip1) n=1 Tax=Durusdinium trenchii TaxID=1381693 RepID=A0ABP0MUX4_9DINO
MLHIACAWILAVLALEHARGEDESCEECEESLSLRQLRSQRQAQAWSFEKPDPELLLWDRVVNATIGAVERVVYNGWLKVPLVHDPALLDFEEPPYLCLRVRGLKALKQPAANGPLLMHCGGPGSGRDCAQRMTELNLDIDGRHQLIASYDVLAIDQRGVNTSHDANETQGGWGEVPACPFSWSGHPVQRFPTIYCDETKKYLDGSKELQQELMEMLMPLDNQTAVQDAWESYVLPTWRGDTAFSTNEIDVRWFYRMVKLEHGLCYEAERYKMKAPNGRVYNALQFAGTVDLAHDMDLLRRALGAPKLSVYGASYGTAVSATYATIFPERSHRLVMDGVLNPFPDTEARGISFSKGIQAVWDGLEEDCERSLRLFPHGSPERCPAAPGASVKVQEVLKGSNQTLAFQLRQLMLIAATHAEDVGPVAMACIQQFHSGRQVPGCDQILPQLGISAGNDTDHFGLGMQALVMATDSSGRLNEEEFIVWWRKASASSLRRTARPSDESYPIGILWSINWMVAMSTWPSYSRPVPPAGASGVPAVIIGNLHDPQTAFESAQLLRRSFPEGYLVTWQGYGHCFKVYQHGSELLKEYNRSKAMGALPAYTNGVGKYACMSKVLSYLQTGHGLVDGHTCLVSEPLRLGRAAVEDATM